MERAFSLNIIEQVDFGLLHQSNQTRLPSHPLESFFQNIAASPLGDSSGLIVNDIIEKIKASFTLENLKVESVVKELEGFREALLNDPDSTTLRDAETLVDILAYKAQFPVAVNIVMMYTDTYVKKDLMANFSVDSRWSQPDFLTCIKTKRENRGVETLAAYERLLERRLQQDNIDVPVETQSGCTVQLNEIVKKIGDILSLFEFILEADKHRDYVMRFEHFFKTIKSKTEEKLQIFDKLTLMQEQAKHWEKLTSQLTDSVNSIKTETRQAGDISLMKESLIGNVSAVIGALPIASIEKDVKMSGSLLSLLSSLNPVKVLSRLDWTCPVCLGNKSEDIMALKQCGHVACSECLFKITTCPICRQHCTSDDRIKIYL